VTAIRAVTLDAAGTLFDVAEPVGATYARFAARHGIALDPGRAERAFRTAFAGAPPLAFGEVGDTERERGWWRAVVRATFGAAATSPAFEACFDELFTFFGRPEAWRIFRDVPDALRRLRAGGRRVAVVSNFDARLVALVDGLGLGALVDGVVPSSRVGAAKPDPAIFRAALVTLGVSPADALHAGDGIASDVEGARAAGLRAVLVVRGRRPARVPPSTIVVSDIAGLATVVEGIDVSRGDKVSAP
jgi:putative hydrolase of the HAD superfamily